MVLNVKVTPLYGSRTDDHAVCTLLSLDGFNILLDCGWTSAYDPSTLAPLAAIAPTVHVVLLSHPDPAHLGALPYACAKLGLTAAVFATLPVWRMGQMAMYDVSLSLDAQTPTPLFNLDDVDATFDYTPSAEKPPRFTLLKYQQQHSLDALPHGGSVVITPHRAGHTVGGTVWHIAKGTETIVYAVHFNHRKERHLNPTTLVNFSRPAHLIVSATNARTRPDSTTTGPDALISAVRRAVRRSPGNILIPVDTSARILELAVQLDSAWERDTALHIATPAVLHPLATRTFDFARSMIEWMSDEVVRRFDVTRDNLFVFKHVKLCNSIADIEAISTPTVVLASSLSMEMGPSRELFAAWATNEQHTVILADRAEPNTLYGRLHAYAQKKSSPKMPSEKKDDGDVEAEKEEPLILKLKIAKKVQLEGEELEKWREEERTRKRLEADTLHREEEAEAEEQRRAAAEEAAKAGEAAATGATASELAVGADADRHDVDMADSGAAGMLMGPGDPVKDEAEEFDEKVLARLRELGVVSASPRAKFVYVPEERVEWDDYGQMVDTSRFIIGEDPGEGGMFEEGDAKAEVANQTEEEEEMVPTKHVSSELDLTVRCEVEIAEFAGLSDGESLKRLLKEVEARFVTVIAGTEEETSFLAEHLLKAMGDAEAVAWPKMLEVVDVRSDMAIHQLSLHDKLVDTVHWSEVGLSRIGFVDGVMTDGADENGLAVAGPRTDDMNDGDMEDEGHGTFLVGTIMLNKLKDRLADMGLKAEFAGGALCVENAKSGAVVLVKKVGGQHLVVDGSLSEEYMQVRDMVYNELVIPR